MARLRPYPVFALAAWSLFVWTSRLGLAWGTEPTLGRKLLATLPVALFVALGAGIVVLLVRRGPATTGGADAVPGEVPPGSLRSLALGAAAWTIAYWAVRMPMITIADHPGAFKVVHAVLAVVSVGLGVWALMTLRSDRSRAALLQS